MNGAVHKATAEYLLELADRSSTSAEDARRLLRMAEVHATLALVEATLASAASPRNAQAVFSATHTQSTQKSASGDDSPASGGDGRVPSEGARF